MTSISEAELGRTRWGRRMDDLLSLSPCPWVPGEAKPLPISEAE